MSGRIVFTTCAGTVISPLRVITLTGSFSFTPHDIANGLEGGYQTITADLNKDGRPDIIALSTRLPDLAWYENPTWTRHVLASGFERLINLAATDVDGDLIPEIAVAASFATRPDASKGLVFLLTHGADVREPWSKREIDRAPTTHRLRWFAADGGEKWLIGAPLVGETSQQPDDNTPETREVLAHLAEAPTLLRARRRRRLQRSERGDKGALGPANGV